MREMVCRATRTTLIARVLDTGAPPSLLEGHVASCLRCHAVVRCRGSVGDRSSSLGTSPPAARLIHGRAEFPHRGARLILDCPAEPLRGVALIG